MQDCHFSLSKLSVSPEKCRDISLKIIRIVLLHTFTFCYLSNFVSVISDSVAGRHQRHIVGFRNDTCLSWYFTGTPDTWSTSLQEQQIQHFCQTEWELQSVHMKHNTTSRAKQKAFSCPRCNKVYNWKSNLQRHVRLECGKAPQFHCSYCPYKTKQKGHLTRHIAKRHQYLYKSDYLQFPSNSGY